MSGQQVLRAAAVAAALLLAGCESREEKAERFYQSALQLLEQGDEDRALVELRNVFQNDGFHLEARRLYAGLLLERGDVPEGYAQYLQLIEQQPDTPDVRRILAEIAVEQGNWEEAERHGREAVRLAPEDPRARALDLALRYREASLSRDDAAREEISREARVLLAQHDDLQIARRIVIDRLLSGANPRAALPEVEKALALEPDSLEFNFAKLRLLILAEEVDGVGEHLQEMFQRFPENAEVQQALVRFYLLQGDLDGAEELLRQLAGADTAAPEGHMVVVQFLQETRGQEAAKAELARLVEANPEGPNRDLYAALGAGIDFDLGQREEAIATVEAILAEAEPSETTRRIKVALARMLALAGNSVGARARVEEVLAEQASNVDALKLRAGWSIEEDRPGDAIVDLRTALSQEPEDVEALTLLAEAHMRDGSPELARERLGAAVEASGAAADPSLRYARFLITQGDQPAARTVLEEARQVSPVNLELALSLAALLLELDAPEGAERILAELQAMGTPEAVAAAARLEAAILVADGRGDRAVDALKARAEEGTVEDVIAAVRAMTDAGQTEQAGAFLEEQIEKRPEEAVLRLLGARLRAGQGQTAEAEAIYRQLIEEDRSAEAPVADLYGLLTATGRPDEAGELLAAALEAQPQARRLRLLKAGELERAGDIAGAIAVYEALYRENTSDVIVANNLASLLSQQAATPEEIDRAVAIARRLRTAEEPAFRDTYGWLLHQQGEFEEALEYLEPAAEGLPEDPVVQFHLGMTYHALGRLEPAEAALLRAIELAGDRPMPQIEQARATLAEIAAGRAAGAPAGDGSPSEGSGSAPGETPPSGEAAPATDDAGTP